ncbi:hypothetical protein [Croceicoccus sp. Ery5]|jgi:hypothetical protein|uniref:hypothetical protein n=1 Tax=Croceicoccus sp. Ery5 TaxID=1703340 RepID=UPI001E46D117|nr:hypothetical protein [Croceicoccus sp. Ery5]
MNIVSRRSARFALLVGGAAALSACSGEGDLVIQEGVGVTAVRSRCPAVGIPAYTGDITTFAQANDTSLASMDVAATMTNLRATCDDSGAKIYSEASFDVLATRRDASTARSVELPFFVTVLQGGNTVQSKRVGTVTVNFAAGQDRAQVTGKGGAFIDAAAATLPEDIRERITRKRRPGDPDAALDPLADPEVKAAVARSTFEVLVGFQLTEAQLAYNATR